MHNYLYAFGNYIHFLLPGFEPGILDSKSRVITTSLQEIITLLCEVSILGPLGYEPNTLPLRHRADIPLMTSLQHMYNATRYFSYLCTFLTDKHYSANCNAPQITCLLTLHFTVPQNCLHNAIYSLLHKHTNNSGQQILNYIFIFLLPSNAFGV